MTTTTAELVEQVIHSLGTPTEILERHGVQVRNRMALCPFHEEKTPSLSFYKDRFKCHGCGAAGSSLDMEAHFQGRSVKDLLRDYSRDSKDSRPKKYSLS